MGSKKKIAIFTEFYPFGKGEEFLEDEIKVAEQFFDEIALISFNKNTKDVTKYIPKNAIVIPVKKQISRRKLQIKRMLGIFSPDVWKQTILCLKERGLKGLLGGLRSSIIEHSVISLLITHEDKWAGKYDIYYSYWLSGFASYLSMRKQYLQGTVVARTHGYDCFFDRGFHAHRKEQFHGLDAIYTISNAGKDDLIAQGCRPEIIHVARLGIIKESESLNPYEQRDEKTLVTCSNIVDLKRLDLLINALSGVEDITINWIHFGDGVLRHSIQALAEEKLGRKKNISFEFKGWTAHERILQFYKEHPIDVFVNCSDVEGVPVSIMEAMSYGIPCIARDVGGNREIVNNDNGILLSSNCFVEELRDAIKQMLHMLSVDYLKERDSALNTYLERYNANKNYASFFEEMVM